MFESHYQLQKRWKSIDFHRFTIFRSISLYKCAVDIDKRRYNLIKLNDYGNLKYVKIMSSSFVHSMLESERC